VGTRARVTPSQSAVPLRTRCCTSKGVIRPVTETYRHADVIDMSKESLHSARVVVPLVFEWLKPERVVDSVVD
jgi:hypothetical protein